MKKLIIISIGIFIIGLSVDANDSEQLQITGQVIDINYEKQSFLLVDSSGQKHNFAITPNSHYEYKSTLSDTANFASIKKNKWVYVKYSSGKQIHTVNNISIF